LRSTLSKSFTFEAAHTLPKVAKGHKCSRLHGHSYKIDVIVEGEVCEEMGWVVDFADITAAWQPLHAKLDHYYLNEVEGLENPTAENLGAWIYHRMKAALPQIKAVVVHETCTASARYEP
jgi:6-pyruvoyltetrahydropterin/6-carboxytetrahydropterin synthase